MNVDMFDRLASRYADVDTNIVARWHKGFVQAVPRAVEQLVNRREFLVRRREETCDVTPQDHQCVSRRYGKRIGDNQRVVVAVDHSFRR
jgi:hypothetical protein